MRDPLPPAPPFAGSPLAAPLSALSAARTWRDIFSLPFPAKVGDLAQPDLLRALNAPEHFMGVHAESKATGIQHDTQLVEWETPPVDLTAQQEFLTLTHAFENAHFHTPHKEWDVLTWKQLTAQPKGNPILHAEFKSRPTMRVYVCPTAAPTYVVSHADTLSILEEHRPAFLDGALPRDPSGGYDIGQIAQDRTLIDVFKSVAKPVDINAVSCMTGATFHYRDERTPAGRVFARAWVFSDVHSCPATP